MTLDEAIENLEIVCDSGAYQENQLRDRVGK